jgi:dynein heavy chain
MLRPLVDGCVEVYTSVCSSLLPTPSKSHYSFNFRDLSRVLSGILSIAPAACGGDVPAALTRLWVHEVQRVFGDRLVCDEDRAWLRQLQQELLVSQFGWAPADRKQQHAEQDVTAQIASQAAVPKSLFKTGAGAQSCTASDALFEGPDQVVFGDFSKIGTSAQERVYEPLAAMSKLAGLLDRYLEEYNISGGKAASAASAALAAAAEGGASSDGKQQKCAAAGGKGRGDHMDLVFFQDAVLHVVRLARVLRQPRCAAQQSLQCSVVQLVLSCTRIQFIAAFVYVGSSLVATRPVAWRCMCLA